MLYRLLDKDRRFGGTSRLRLLRTELSPFDCLLELFRIYVVPSKREIEMWPTVCKEACIKPRTWSVQQTGSRTCSANSDRVTVNLRQGPLLSRLTSDLCSLLRVAAILVRWSDYSASGTVKHSHVCSLQCSSDSDSAGAAVNLRNPIHPNII